MRIDQLIAHAIATWNLSPLPRCRYTVFNLPKIAQVKEKFDVFSIDEINKAIANLGKYYEDEESKFRPSSFENFITRSLDRWTDEAKPWERYEKQESTVTPMTDEEIDAIWK